MKVTAAVARAPEAVFSIEEPEIDEPRADEIPLRVVGAGRYRPDRGRPARR
jgi:aryl-alcohol dehydrogenase